jgi:putative transposase
MIDGSPEHQDGPTPMRAHDAWARLRFAVVGRLLAAPPARGELRGAIEQLASRVWQHPITGEPVRFATSTIERWYYQARNARTDPVGELRRRVRSDAGQQPSIQSALAVAIRAQHKAHPGWTVQLHFDNLVALSEIDSALGSVPSYSTIRRFMRANGLDRQRRKRLRKNGEPLVAREVRGYEFEYVHGLWHADFHHGSRRVLTRDGRWRKVVLLAMLDDRSRLCCHAQWYLDEQAESFVHGLSQALQKRGLPRALMTDNGAAMRAEETRWGLHDLSIKWQPTLPYSPFQNGKQEVFWGNVEERLMAMLEGEDELRLDYLNEATQAWVELEYNVETHSEIGTSPLRRFLDDKSVGRDCPNSESLRSAFRGLHRRQQRRTDGTIALFGRRLELPSRLRTLRRVTVRAARWDLGFVHAIDERSGAVLCRLYPQDKQRNADGVRRVIEPVADQAAPPCTEPSGTAPLLRKLLTEYSATGLPPAYLPKDDLGPLDDA